MKIIKQLKNATFEYDEEAKSFTISGEHPALRDVSNTVKLNKVYAFAFMRFVVRIAQRNWLKANRTPSRGKESLASLEEEYLEHSDQLLIFED
tara:strand:- start:211 stop:489 length:279 start_codon:yes stop_codon:yes gene_type:complete